MAPRHKVFSVTIKDCRVDTFTCGGKGGSGKDTSNNGVRITHPPSGAVGEARDSRYQHQNKRAAWVRMGKSPAFQAWAQRMAAELSTGRSIEDEVEAMMTPDNIRVEVGKGGRWERE
jgi:protein subunit release factor A